MHIPKNNDERASRGCLNFHEEGTSSLKDIYSIIPQTIAKIIPRINSLIKGFKKKNDKNAPNGSVIPDRNEYFIALYLLFVAK